MSYIIGWKNDTSVFLIGDTLLTYPGGSKIITEEISTFDQQLIRDNTETQIEGCLKIFNFSNRLLIGFASNDVLKTVELLEHIEEHLDLLNVRDDLKRILDIHHDNDSQLIIGFIEDGKPVLLTYDRDLTEYQEESPIQIGSGNDIKAFSDLSFDICDQLSEHSDLTNEESLLLGIAAHQQLITKMDVIHVGAGGLVSGALINVSGVTWQPSISYLNYHYDGSDPSVNIRHRFSNVGIIHTRFFRDVMAFFSSYPTNPAFMRGYLFRCSPNYGTVEQRSKRAKYRVEHLDLNEAQAYLDNPNPRYVILFSTQGDQKSRIVIVRYYDLDQPFIKISPLRNGFYDIDISPTTLELAIPDNSVDQVQYGFLPKKHRS